MVKKKGIGYIIESFVSSLIVLVFVLSSFNSISNYDQDWNSFENDVTAEDATYVLQKTGYIEKMLENGDTRLLSSIGSSMTDSRLETSGSLDGPPTGSYTVGLFARTENSEKVEVTQVSAGDRCYGDLEEVDSESGLIYRTTASSLIENRHDTRVYFADIDPRNPGRFNGIPDFDSYYVDRGNVCQFSSSEGPHNMERTVEIRRNQINTYQFQNLSTTENEVLTFESPLLADIKNQLGKYKAARISYDMFNFSGNYEENDMIIFSGKETLDNISAKESEFTDYARDNPVLLNMDPTAYQLENGVLEDLGYSYVNLTQSSPPTKKVFFSGTQESRRLKSYLNMLGYTANDINIDPKNVTSLDEGRIKSEPLIGSSNFNYNTDEWNYANDSMRATEGSEIDQAGNLPETSCSQPHSKGMFKLTRDTETVAVPIYTTALSGDAAQCNIYGVSIDRNRNEIIEDSEQTYLNGETAEIFGRDYTIKINSQNDLELVYTGPDSVEVLNPKKRNNNYRYDKLIRLSEVDSSSGDGEKGMLGATILYMIEGENTFGTEQTGNGVTRGVISDNGVYTVTMRWSE